MNPMNDDFLARFRESPRPEFEAALYRQISQATNTKNRLLRFRLLTVSLLVIALVMALLFVNPAMQAWAQAILKFFTPAQDNTFVLPPQPTAPEIAVTPTYAAPAHAGCEPERASLPYRDAIDRAETALDFNIHELPAEPEGFTFICVRVDLTHNLSRLIYAREGGELVITQIHGSAPPSWESVWAAVPAASVEEVRINGFDGEYVRGMFVVKSQTGTEAVWEPDAPVQRLRWHEGDMLFEIQMAGLPGDDDAIGKNWLISLAESLK